MSRHVLEILSSKEMNTKEKTDLISSLGLGNSLAINVIIKHSIDTGEFIPVKEPYNISSTISGISIYDEMTYWLNTRKPDKSIAMCLKNRYDILNLTCYMKEVIPQIVAVMTIYSFSEELYDSVSNLIQAQFNRRHVENYKFTDLYSLMCYKLRYRLSLTKDIRLLIDFIECLEVKDQIILKEFIKSIDIEEDDTDNFKKFIEYIL